MWEILYTVYPEGSAPYPLPRFIVRANSETHARDEADRIVHGSQGYLVNPLEPQFPTCQRTIHVREILR